MAKSDSSEVVKRPRGRPPKVSVSKKVADAPTAKAKAEEKAEPIKERSATPAPTVKAGAEEKEELSKERPAAPARIAMPTKSVPRDQPSEWVVPRRDEEHVVLTASEHRASTVSPMDEDTVVHASSEISDDEINARREAARAVVAGISRMRNEVKSMNSYIVTPPSTASETPVSSDNQDSSEDAEQPLSRRDYWRQRRQERYLQRQQRRMINGTAPASQFAQGSQPAARLQGSNTVSDKQQRNIPNTNNRRDRQNPRQNPRFSLEHQDKIQVVHDVPQQSLEILPPMNMADLQGLSATALLSMAAEQDVSETLASHDKHEVVFALLRHYAARGGAIVGEGVLEICPEGHGFLRNRWNSFKSCPEDSMVPQQIIQKFGLRAGDKITGATRPPSRDLRERRFVIIDVSAVNAAEPSTSNQVPLFESLVATHPSRRLRLETTKDEVEMRIMSIFAPVGFGQRGLIVAPPRAGKTMLLQKMANAIAKNHPTTERIVLLIGERPEDVTDMERNANAKVYAATFDEAPECQVQVAEVVMDMARRSAERGKDVVILLASITRLVRAYHAIEPSGGKTFPSGIDVNALQKALRFFGAARNIEDGGSLTVLATVAAENGSKMDEAILENFKGACNWEFCLDQQLVDKRLYPAINIERSGTRKEELILDPKELAKTVLLRKTLDGVCPADAMGMVLKRIKEVASNAELLLTVREEEKK